MNRAQQIADQVVGRLQGAWDAVRGTSYAPATWPPTNREKGTYGRWLDHREPRNAYERAAFWSYPREIEAEMDRVDALTSEIEAAEQAEADAYADAAWDEPWPADLEPEAGT